MPVKAYYGGHGRKVMRQMKRKYGAKRGQAIFYATVNTMRKGSKAQKAAQPKRAPGARRR
jgi:hypothetical protein